MEKACTLCSSGRQRTGVCIRTRQGADPQAHEPPCLAAVDQLRLFFGGRFGDYSTLFRTLEEYRFDLISRFISCILNAFPNHHILRTLCAREAIIALPSEDTKS